MTPKLTSQRKYERVARNQSGDQRAPGPLPSDETLQAERKQGEGKNTSSALLFESLLAETQHVEVYRLTL